VVNAFLAPIMARYLQRLEDALEGARLSVFRSNGGILSARHAGEEAVQTLLSGPAAGVLGAWEWARAGDMERLITFDMGGTSTDVSLCDGAVTLTTEAEVGGHPVRLPMVDIHTVGAGGGSLARRDTGGALLVGPRSAGADPGPACYGKGNRPTVTDAQLVLGRIRVERFLGGQMPLHRERAEEAVGRLARELDLSPLETAAGIVRVANAGMERAIRVVSLARGRDPRRFALFCFGGAGGLHAADLARGLGIPEVIIPPDAGTFSAFGMMAADVVRDASRAVLEPLPAVGRGRRDRLAESLEERLREEMRAEGFEGEDVVLRRSLDLRYRGQSFELTVPEGEDPSASFHDLHLRRYGHHRPAVEVELVAIRVRAVGQVPTPPVEARPEGPSEPPPPDEEASVWFRDGFSTTGVYERRRLAPGHRLDGPAVVTEAGSTTVVPPGWKLRVDGHANLRLAPEGG
jgi:N-methylhydantoinase A